MYLLGECLLEGAGTRQNKDAALGWFAAAGDLGHRGARSRVLSALVGAQTSEDNERLKQRFASASGLKASRWVEGLA